MGRGGYHGGGTLIGYGMRWSDSADFPVPESPVGAPAPNKKKKAKKKPFEQKQAAPRQCPENSATAIPPERISLIASVMHDIGRPLPRKAIKRNRALHRLLAEGIVLPDGKLNTKHGCLQLWLQRMEQTESD